MVVTAGIIKMNYTCRTQGSF